MKGKHAELDAKKAKLTSQVTKLKGKVNSLQVRDADIVRCGRAQMRVSDG